MATAIYNICICILLFFILLEHCVCSYIAATAVFNVCICILNAFLFLLEHPHVAELVSSCLSPPYSIWTPVDSSGLSPQPSLLISVMTGVDWSSYGLLSLEYTGGVDWTPLDSSELW